MLSPGPSRQIVSFFEIGLFRIFYPQELIIELNRIPQRPRLAQRISPATLASLIALIENRGQLVTPSSIPKVSRDPADDVFLACAAESQSDFLVTGDADLLVLETHGRTRIIPPTDFLLLVTRT